MGGFYADHAAIMRFGTTVGSHAGGTSTADAYARTWVHVPDDADGEIFRNFIGTARDVEDSLGAGLVRLREILDASGRELVASADYYRDTDEASAAAFDAHLIGEGQTGSSSHSGTHGGMVAQ